MHHTLAHIARIAENSDMAALCNWLSFFQEGDVIDENLAAQVIGCDRDTTRFLLDTLFEVGAIQWEPDPPAMAMAA